MKLQRPVVMMLLALVLQLLAAGGMGGCALSRHDQLKSRARAVEKGLRSEQRRVLAMEETEADRAARLDNLRELRGYLSAANIGLGTVPHFIAEERRDIAYDVLEEAYDTIEWNIPLGPADQRRPLPAQFSGGVLRLDGP